MTHEDGFKAALYEAQKATCTHAKCGAVIVKGNAIIGRGYNAPPGDDEEQRMCNTELRGSSKPKSDRTCCVHAEWRAIISGLLHFGDLTGASLYFARADEMGSMIHSGPPYCTVCSRLALEVGLLYFGLWHADGISMYTTTEYNRLSYAFHSS